MRLMTRVVTGAGRFKTGPASGINPVENQTSRNNPVNRPATGFLKSGWNPVEIEIRNFIRHKTGWILHFCRRKLLITQLRAWKSTGRIFPVVSPVGNQEIRVYKIFPSGPA